MLRKWRFGERLVSLRRRLGPVVIRGTAGEGRKREGGPRIGKHGQMCAGRLSFLFGGHSSLPSGGIRIVLAVSFSGCAWEWWTCLPPLNSLVDPPPPSSILFGKEGGEGRFPPSSYSPPRRRKTRLEPQSAIPPRLSPYLPLFKPLLMYRRVEKKTNPPFFPPSLPSPLSSS